MKIEKVNENQIRCTLTKQDLADRQINLRELAYGSEKAKGLFHDMIQQANYEFGFDVSDNPLMVEAIPLSSESLVLLITKVEYPEELDTRFSQFTEGGDEEELFSNMGQPEMWNAKGQMIFWNFSRKYVKQKPLQRVKMHSRQRHRKKYRKYRQI